MKGGRVPDGTGLSQAEPSGLRPTGFDPARDARLLHAYWMSKIAQHVQRLSDTSAHEAITTMGKLARSLGISEGELAPEEFSPNSSDLPEFQIRQSDVPGKAWLSLNQLLPWGAVSQITEIVKEANVNG